jgi:Spy/CpxP family protein refolding chaperone
MADEIDLTPKQIEQIEALYEKMRSRAIPLGRRLIDLERRLNEEFADGTVTDESLRDLLGEIAETRMELRYVHLVTHLETPEILRPEQITEYNRLRGYGEGHEERHDHGS